MYKHARWCGQCRALKTGLGIKGGKGNPKKVRVIVKDGRPVDPEAHKILAAYSK